MRVWLSAQTGEGLELLLQAISERVGDEVYHHWLRLEPSEGSFRAQLYAQGAVLNEITDETGAMEIEIRLQKKDFLQLLSRAGIRPERYLKVVH